MRPGCWGSAVIYRVGSDECGRCSYLKTCAVAVRASESVVKDTILKMDTLFSTSTFPAVERWFAARWKEPVVDNSAHDRIKHTMEAWRRAGLNVFHLKEKSNPVKNGSHLYHSLFQFMLDEGPFKPRDLVEHLRETHHMQSKAQVERIVKNACDALVSLGVLKKDGRSILCL